MAVRALASLLSVRSFMHLPLAASSPRRADWGLWDGRRHCLDSRVPGNQVQLTVELCLAD